MRLSLYRFRHMSCKQQRHQQELQSAYFLLCDVSDVRSGERGAFEIAVKLIKSRPCCKKVGYSVFPDPGFLSLATLAGQLVKTPSLYGKCFGKSLVP